MEKILTFLWLCVLTILSGSCSSPIQLAVYSECGSLTTCSSVLWPSPTTQPVSVAECSVTTASTLRELMKNDDTIANMSEEIIMRYELTADELMVETSEHYVRYTWGYQEDRYRIYKRDGEKYLGYVFFENTDPPLSQIIACLGEPEWYSSEYGPLHELFRFNLILYYPEYGLVAYSSQLLPRQREIVITENLNASELRLTPPATIEDVISFLFFTPEGAQTRLERLRPWPGSLETTIETIRANYCLDYPDYCEGDQP